ncbi:MAG: AraC family transcriptional regulator [Solirubrobacteraceae bacterium]|nr:AraC family transcriptional regulator [Solirubrobacteraceae bacterium]
MGNPLEHLNRAMDLLEAQLHDRVDVGALARVALTSEFHFRRVFSTLAGMSISDYVRRRRMTLAAPQIVAGDETVLAIATRWGYGSADAFGRAFRDFHGTGPSAARDPGATLRTQQRLVFHLTLEGETDVRHRIITKDAFRIVGATTRARLQYEGVNAELQAFSASVPMETNFRLKALSDGEPAGIITAHTDFTEEREDGSAFSYWHGVATTHPVPEDLDSLEVPAGDWVVFSTSGAFPASLQGLWPYAHAEWFPSHPYQQVAGPELVRIAPAHDFATADCELWLPVERR